MNTLLNGMKQEANYGYTENGGVKHITTHSDLLDMFAMGGSMRNRSDDDVIFMFKKAYEENPEYALKCLFYLRNCRGGAGERRFFRVVIHWLANELPEVALRNMKYIPLFGRWDDLYALVGTSIEHNMFLFMHSQFVLDMDCNTPSLLGKWLKSENCSSIESKRLATKTRNAFQMTAREYRKSLSVLRNRINIVETLMSQNRWDEIEFDKLPSKAGLKYKNAFAQNEITAARYREFMFNKDTKVNAGVLNPVDIAGQIFSNWHPTDIERKTWDKYWANLKDYYNGREEPGIAVVDVSGSMTGTPMNAAVSMGAYIAEHGKGPFHNHFITFSGNPHLVEFNGIDLYDKFQRAKNAEWGQNTNIEAVFDLLLSTAKKYKTRPEDMPKTIYIFSDMEFDQCVTSGPVRKDRWDYGYARTLTEDGIETVIEKQMRKWRQFGYDAPRVIFWNLDARTNNIPALDGAFSYVSGFSMAALEGVLSGKDGYDMMMDVLNNSIYKDIK